jgi:hypothetical protein
VPTSRDSTTFEAVVTTEDTAEPVTLHYPLNEPGSSGLFDDMAAGETLLMLSESGERGQGSYLGYLVVSLSLPQEGCSDL